MEPLEMELNDSATSSKIRLFNPIKWWILLNFGMLLLLCVSGVYIVTLSYNEQQKLVTSQLDILIRSRMNDLEYGRYRNFVEGIGGEFQDVWIEIESGVDVFRFGTEAGRSICAVERLGEYLGHPVVIRLCRQNTTPLIYLVSLLTIYLICSVISAYFLVSLERSAVSVLTDFFKRSGVDTGCAGGLVGLLSGIREIHQKLLETRQREIENQKDVATGELARQVAHDIRSPLLALEIAAQSMSAVPENVRNMVRSAISRIRDISNALMTPQKEIIPSKTPQQLACLIDELVDEKKVQYQGHGGISIGYGLTSDMYGIFSSVGSIAFKRIMSNLIDNGVEAISKDGVISVSLELSGDAVRIKVCDTGKGIPSERVPDLMKKGNTFGKTGGSGLGLYHARTTIESYGGTISISSVWGIGTTVTITLPSSPAPKWFVQAVRLPDDPVVVIVDDDELVHRVWDERLNAISSDRIIHLSSGKALKKWVKSNSLYRPNTLYLIDYQFSAEVDNGVDLIANHAIEEQSILVTSRYEEVIKDELFPKVLPKRMVRVVPIEVGLGKRA